MGLAIIMIILILPLFIIIIVISFVLFYKCINFFQLTAREIKRLDGNFRAPVISSFKELINESLFVSSLYLAAVSVQGCDN